MPPATDPGPLHLLEPEARAVLLAQALEEADPEGENPALRDRRAATDAALAEAGDDDAGRFLVVRARRLLAGRDEGWRLPRVPLLWGVLAALLAGLATNTLGDERRIHVLRNPLLALVAWNLLVYAVGLGRLVFRRRIEDLGTGTLGWATAAFDRAFGRGASGPRARFLVAWGRATHALRLARLRWALHVAAALMAVGALGGMYLRGLVVEYRATWESTFLSEEASRRVLSLLLAPGLLARGEELTDLSALTSEEGGPADEWLHRYAWTVAFLVVLPRTLLAGFAARRAGHLAGRIPIDTSQAYFRRLFAPARGEATLVQAVPYSHEPQARALEGLRDLLGDLLGGRAQVEILPKAEYGAEGSPFGPSAQAGCARTLVLLFPLAQSPENEVHGRLVAETKADLGADEALLVLVDGGGYRARLGEGAEERLAERKRAWDRVVAAEGLAAVHVDLDRPDADGALTAASDGLWTAAD